MAQSDSRLVERPTDVPVKFENWQRILKSQPTINDQVESIVAILADEAVFRAYINGTTDDDTVEGSMAADNLMAAQMIRTKAVELDGPLAQKKLTVISKSLNVVMRRYHLARNERRQTVGGQLVPDNHSNPE